MRALKKSTPKNSQSLIFLWPWLIAFCFPQNLNMGYFLQADRFLEMSSQSKLHCFPKEQFFFICMLHHFLYIDLWNQLSVLTKSWTDTVKHNKEIFSSLLPITPLTILRLIFIYIYISHICMYVHIYTCIHICKYSKTKFQNEEFEEKHGQI